MDVMLSWSDGAAIQGETSFEVPDDADESAFWETVAEHLAEVPMPLDDEPDVSVRVECRLGSCTLDIKGREPHYVEGKPLPSPAIFPAEGSEDGMPGLAPSTYPEMYLTFCSEKSTGGRGSYKFYRFIPNPDGTIGAEYGRIGQNSGFGAPRRISTPYPGWMYRIKVAEKFIKGYRDESAAYLGERMHEGSQRVQGGAMTDLTPSQKLFQLLTDAARSYVRKALRFPNGVSEAQVKESKQLLKEMARRKSVEGFNRQLMHLLQVAPRSIGSVQAELARKTSDFPSIIAREEDLVAAMEGVLGRKSATDARGKDRPSFDSLGVSVSLAGVAERAEVLSKLSRRLRSKVVEIYSVDCLSQSERFAQWVEARGIDDVRLLWHGSPAGNWASIVENSLRLPAAADVAHGSMFGRGIYFGSIGAGASEACDGGGEKSWGYVGARDSYWQRRGETADVYMALFDVAYGKPASPADVTTFNQTFLDLIGCDCVHARRGEQNLRNDEIIVYDPRAVRIRYLVRFSA